jgi:phage terminase large subunit
LIQQTTSLRKVASLKKRIRVIRGGQGAGKTISILILLINHAASKADKEILVISAELTKMRLTVIKDFVKLMKLIGIFDESRFIAETLYRYPNGSFIKFIGLDKSDVGKGLRSDVAYFNEVNKCDFESYRQVASRAKIVFADYNPDAEFYIDTDVITRKDCDFLQLTFEDNELLSPDERSEILLYKEKGYNEDESIKNSYWANLWQVYGLGNIGNLEGVVFSNWSIVDEIPKEATFISHGLDWGFSNDPTALIEVHKYDGKIYVNELVYQTKLTNSDIINKLKHFNINSEQCIVADSAEPKSIQDVSNAGFWVEAAKKGPDSIKASIDRLQQYEICITSKSTNLIKELRQYRWAKDKEGKALNAPEDAFNHTIDALRYVALNKLSQFEANGEYSLSGDDEDSWS